jgi:Bacterial type II and III secretion system protein
MRPFRAAMRALALGSVVLGIVALLHEDSPVARLLAERRTEEQNSQLPVQTDATTIGFTPTHSSARPDLGLSPQQAVTDHNPRNTPAPDARTGKDSGRIWAASQSVPRGDRRAAIQLGPLEDTASTNAGKARTPFANAADPGPFVTRTYRPISMSAVSLERLVRPLLTERGEAIAANAGSAVAKELAHAAGSAVTIVDAESTDRPGVLIVSDRPEAIGRVDALCHDLESTSPRIAIDLVVLSVVPTTGRQLPWDQWRNSFGSVDSDLPSVFNQIRGLGHTTLRANSQLQTISGAWAELEWSEQNIVPGNNLRDAEDSADRDPANARSISVSKSGAPAVTTLRIRPSSQSEGAIRIEVRAQSSQIDDHTRPERPQLVTVRFNTEVVLREGATGVINLFVDEPPNMRSAPASPGDVAAALVMPGGPLLPAAKIVPQPGQREQTLLLLMPRIAAPPRVTGKVAASKAHDPA